MWRRDLSWFKVVLELAGEPDQVSPRFPESCAGLVWSGFVVQEGVERILEIDLLERGEEGFEADRPDSRQLVRGFSLLPSIHKEQLIAAGADHLWEVGLPALQ
ncbi:MAG: hypothetical protein GY953_47535, partial [bacterium]|nr:hypothetical protein [bacterium]